MGQRKIKTNKLEDILNWIKMRAWPTENLWEADEVVVGG